MIETSWSNHYKIGYDHRWFGMRESATDELMIDEAGCGRQPLGVSVECVNSARLMTEKYGLQNIAVLYSGGQDSEIVVLSFLAHGRIPRLVFLDYEGANEFDRVNAVSFCRYYGLKLDIVPMPAQEMLKSGESIEVCGRYQCGQAGLSFYLKAIEELSRDYYVVTGDEPYIELITHPLTGQKDWFFFAREAFYSLWKVFHLNQRDGCPNFIQYTPESWLAFFEDPIIKWLLAQEDVKHSNAVKYGLYNQRFFTKRRGKSTGMEQFNDLIVTANKELLQALPLCSTQELRFPFARLHHYLTRYI